MRVTPTSQAIEYPESDGRPMGETDEHIEWLIRLRDILKYRYRGQRVYVGANLLVYYEEGEPARHVAPDVFVVLDCDPGRRRTFRVWEEGRTPDVVFELTSKSSRREDRVFKSPLYAQLGVKEYFLYDPLGEYLDPPLQGSRLREGVFQTIEPDDDGRLECAALDVRLRLAGRELVLEDRASGQTLRTEAEAAEAAWRSEQAARQSEQAARQSEQAAREAAEKRMAELEMELQRLRGQLEQQDR